MYHVTFIHKDSLVITAEIGDYDIKRVLIHLVSSTDVLFLEALKMMGCQKKDLKEVNFPLMGFT